MSKQKTSFSLSEVAESQLGEIADANGLNKSTVLEILIRQAHSVKWSVVEKATPLPPPGLKDEPIDYTVLRQYVPSGTGYNAVVRYIEREGLKTWQAIAKAGIKPMYKERGLGKDSINNVRILLLSKGITLVP